VADEGVRFDPATLDDRSKSGQMGWGLFRIGDRSPAALPCKLRRSSRGFVVPTRPESCSDDHFWFNTDLQGRQAEPQAKGHGRRAVSAGLTGG
jgi:hypothetical protein